MEDISKKLYWTRNKGIPGNNSREIEYYQVNSGRLPGTTEFIRTQLVHRDIKENHTLTFTWINNIKKYRRNKNPTIPIDVHTLENLAKAKMEKAYPQDTPRSEFQFVEIEDYGRQVIQDNLVAGDLCNLLLEEYHLNIIKKYTGPFQFYTDGSLGRVQDQSLRMGAAWIQTDGSNPGRSFQAAVDNWPSSTRAELVAIILAILSVPNDSAVEIRTDSSSCINSYAKIIKPHPKDTLRKQMKKPNWQLRLRLADIITKKKLQLKLTKVKAHSKDLNNNQVDQLAKKAKEEPEV
jgi:ribonuclease HI